MLYTFIILLTIAVIVWKLFPERVSELFDRINSVMQPQQPHISKAEMDADIRQLAKELACLKDENIRLRQQFDNLVYKYQENKTEYDNLLKRLHNDIVSLRQNQDAVKTEVGRRLEALDRSLPKPQPPTPPKPVYPQKWYARYPDTDCNGFRIDRLSDISSDSIYEIVVTSAAEAVYHLVPDRAVRSQLFSMLNHVIRPFCDITVESQTPENIVDVDDGLLVRSGDCWKIKTKASIKLV